MFLELPWWGDFKKSFSKIFCWGPKEKIAQTLSLIVAMAGKKKQFLVAEGGFEVISPSLWGYLICTGKCFP